MYVHYAIMHYVAVKYNEKIILIMPFPYLLYACHTHKLIEALTLLSPHTPGNYKSLHILISYASYKFMIDVCLSYISQ